MNIVVATDIHGTNDQLRSLFRQIDRDILYLSPWEGDGSPFASEQEAVAAFHADHGLARFQQKIAQALASRPALLLGFSVGATSMWLYAGSEQCDPGSHAMLYYGSRIRDHLDVAPRCPTSLIFAQHESSFQPESLVEKISSAQARCTIVAGAHHGFMNPQSTFFRPELAQENLVRISQCHAELSARGGRATG